MLTQFLFARVIDLHVVRITYLDKIRGENEKIGCQV
jgi:hypothetical protein